MIYQPIAAHVAKTEILPHHVEGRYRPLERAPGRSGPVSTARRALSRLLTELGHRLDPGPSRVAINDPCT